MNARRVGRPLAAALCAALLSLAQTALAGDKFDDCADPEAARRYVKNCLAESPYRTQEYCEAQALQNACKPRQ